MRFIILILFVCFPVICWSSSDKISVEITGLPKEEQEIVLSNLSIKKSEKDKNLTDDHILSLYEISTEEISTTLQSIGYYHAKIRADILSNEGKNTYLVTYQVNLGDPIIITTLSLKITGDGKDQSALESMIKNPVLKKNKILKHDKYEAFKQNLLGTTLGLGYLDAHFTTNKVLVNTASNQAEIILMLETGKRYAFGSIHFISSPYPTEYLKQYIPFSSGVPYTTDRLLALQKNLLDTDLFAKVKLNPNLNKTQDYRVPVNITLSPKPSNKYTTSLGFGTDSGPRGMVGWERQRKSHPGHRINLNFWGSKRLNQANAQYTILGKNPAIDRIVFGTKITEEKPVDKKYSLQNASGITHIQKKGQFEQILGLHYLSVVFRKLPTDPKNHAHFLLPNIGYTWNTLKKESLLQRGIHVSANVQGGLKSALSTTNMVQGVVRLKGIIPITNMSRIILRGDLGSIATHQFDKIPWNLRFFTGGDRTIRGFGYNSIGPQEKDLNGDLIVVGGRHLIVGSTEFERRIYKNIGAAIFVDTGNAMNKWGARLKTSAGFGVRYETPLGPLRLDIARPMMRGKQKPRLHLTFGMNL
ncbi:MAG TPA: BamA/TamA family outer membrane protein [Gammaproteobacteria bacterium]|nr:BamA/TamA family outer membrane protein [Gammaproteobacteria bacterium]HRA43002.1 BamA/TamA family outer membrane protein [Gammaproteobacteria bacterium]